MISSRSVAQVSDLIYLSFIWQTLSVQLLRSCGFRQPLRCARMREQRSESSSRCCHHHYQRPDNYVFAHMLPRQSVPSSCKVQYPCRSVLPELSCSCHWSGARYTFIRQSVQPGTGFQRLHLLRGFTCHSGDQLSCSRSSYKQSQRHKPPG